MGVASRVGALEYRRRDQHTCPWLPPAGGDDSAWLAQGPAHQQELPKVGNTRGVTVVSPSEEEVQGKLCSGRNKCF